MEASASQKPCSGVLFEELDAADVAPKYVDAFVASHFHHLEDGGTVFGGRGEEAGAETVAGRQDRRDQVRVIIGLYFAN
jgi:hypothetical protein